MEGPFHMATLYIGNVKKKRDKGKILLFAGGV